MTRRASKKKPRGLTIADIEFRAFIEGFETLLAIAGDVTPRCAHCGRAFLSSSPVELQSDAVVVTCLYRDCGCWTPFRRSA